MHLSISRTIFWVTTLASTATLALAQAPTISATGVLNGATLVRSNLAPGAIVTIFGENLAAAPMAATGMPLPRTLGGVSVMFDGQPGALLFVSPTQVNVQAPWSALDAGQTTRMVAVMVNREGRGTSAPMNAMFGMVSPGLFTLNGSGTGMAVVMNAADGTYAQAASAVPGLMTRAARIGSIISLYGTGLGAVNPSLPTGQPSSDLFRRNRMVAEVTIGGRPAEVLYAGLSAELPGVNQVNVVVPAGVTAGNLVPVQIKAGGMTSPERVTVAIDGALEPAVQRPGADGAAIWDYVTRQNYRQNFSLIPGKNQLYQGIAPHSFLLTVYVNQIAREAIDKKSGSMPAGSIVIKDAHGPTGDFQNALLMYKIPGFDPPNGDWYWSTRRNTGAVGTSGSIAGCYNCHTRSAANDQLFLATPVAPPAPNAPAIRDYIAKQNYRETWRMWPGTTANQPSSAPHGATVSIFMNETAYDALQNGDGKMPVGAMVIKENFMPDKTLAALTVMYKSPGFDPANNDWYWLQQLANGTAAAAGKVEGCTSCHLKVKDNDFLYTGSIAPRPEPKGAAVWNYVAAQDYRKNWKLWPGTTAQAVGNAPHGAFISTYVNDLALAAITGKRGALPPGAIVVKENFMPDKTLAAVTLMYKSPGFDPDRNDWFWMQRLANGMIAAEGKVNGCISCHTQVASNDYLNAGPVR